MKNCISYIWFRFFLVNTKLIYDIFTKVLRTLLFYFKSKVTFKMSFICYTIIPSDLQIKTQEY